MKVLVVPSWYPTSDNQKSGIFFKEQVIELRNSGLDLTVAFPEILSLKTFRLKGVKKKLIRRNEDGVLTFRLQGYNFFPRSKKIYKDIYHRRLKKIFKVYIKEFGKPDIVHAHSILWGGWAASKLCNELKIPLIVTEHSSAFGRGTIKEWQKPLIKETLNNTKMLIAVSESLKSELVSYVSVKKIVVIPNLVKLPSLVQIETSKNKFRFFSLANLTHNKGLDLLIKAFATRFKNNMEVELVIGGDGVEKSNLQLLVEELQMKKQISFIGSLTRSQVAEEMNKCNVFVLPSRYETFGVVYIEALTYGKPIVASKCGGPEMIVNKENGLLCDVDDIDDLSDKLIYIYHNNKLYNKEQIIKDVNSRFSPETVCKQITNLYHSLTSEA